MMTALDEVQCNLFGKYSPSSDHTFYNTLHWPNANLTSAYVRNVGDKLRLYSELFMTLDINDPMSKVRTHRWLAATPSPIFLRWCSCLTRGFLVDCLPVAPWRRCRPGTSTCSVLNLARPTHARASRTTSRTPLSEASSRVTAAFWSALSS